MYAKVEDNAVVRVASRPKWLDASGASVDDETLAAHGWLPVLTEPPPHNSALQFAKEREAHRWFVSIDHVSVVYDLVDIPIEEIRAAKLREVRQTYDAVIQFIADDYPAYERESWPMQVGEADALLADAGAVTPWIDSAASGRGITRLDLAQRIKANDAAYRMFHGFVSGIRQGHEDAILALDTRQAIVDYDATARWPQ